MNEPMRGGGGVVPLLVQGGLDVVDRVGVVGVQQPDRLDHVRTRPLLSGGGGRVRIAGIGWTRRDLDRGASHGERRGHEFRKV